MIRIEVVWLAVQPLDMRAGTEADLARVVNVFGEVRPHHAYNVVYEPEQWALLNLDFWGARRLAQAGRVAPRFG